MIEGDASRSDLPRRLGDLARWSSHLHESWRFDPARRLRVLRLVRTNGRQCVGGRRIGSRSKDRHRRLRWATRTWSTCPTQHPTLMAMCAVPASTDAHQGDRHAPGQGMRSDRLRGQRVAQGRRAGRGVRRRHDHSPPRDPPTDRIRHLRRPPHGDGAIGGCQQGRRLRDPRRRLRGQDLRRLLGGLRRGSARPAHTQGTTTRRGTGLSRPAIRATPKSETGDHKGRPYDRFTIRGEGTARRGTGLSRPAVRAASIRNGRPQGSPLRPIHHPRGETARRGRACPVPLSRQPPKIRYGRPQGSPLRYPHTPTGPGIDIRARGRRRTAPFETNGTACPQSSPLEDRNGSRVYWVR